MINGRYWRTHFTFQDIIVIDRAVKTSYNSFLLLYIQDPSFYIEKGHTIILSRKIFPHCRKLKYSDNEKSCRWYMCLFMEFENKPKKVNKLFNFINYFISQTKIFLPLCWIIFLWIALRYLLVFNLTNVSILQLEYNILILICKYCNSKIKFVSIKMCHTIFVHFKWYKTMLQ